MKLRLRKIPSVYFSSWWAPTGVYIVLLAAFAGITLLRVTWMAVVCEVLFIFVGIALLGILCAGVWNLLRKRWAKGISNLVLLPACGVGSLYTVGYLMFALMFGQSEDGFADNLTIPENIEVVEPLDDSNATPSNAKDAFQQSLMTALSTAEVDDSTITADVATLAMISRKSPMILRRYLATTPAWRVSRENGSVFATRRWMIESNWQTTLHGYYSDHDLRDWPTDSDPRFQTRFTIGLRNVSTALRQLPFEFTVLLFV